MIQKYYKQIPTQVYMLQGYNAKHQGNMATVYLAVFR